MTTSDQKLIAKEIFETIRNNYAALHYLLYSLLIVKSYRNASIPLSNEQIEKGPFYVLHHHCIRNFPWEITLEDASGCNYIIRKDIAAWAAEVEMDPLKYCENPKKNAKDRDFWPIQQSVLITIATQIVRYMHEMLKDKNCDFRKYFDSRLSAIKWQTGDFFDVVSFIRHVLVHTTSFNYTIDTTESLDRGWIPTRKGKKIELKFVIQKWYDLDIHFETTVAELNWKNLFQIIPTYQIYMLLEVFMYIAEQYYAHNS